MLSKSPRVDADDFFVGGVESNGRVVMKFPVNLPFVGFAVGPVAFAPFGLALMLNAVAEHVPEILEKVCLHVEMFCRPIFEFFGVPLVLGFGVDSVITLAKRASYGKCDECSVAAWNRAESVERNYEPANELFKCVAHEEGLYV